MQGFCNGSVGKNPLQYRRHKRCGFDPGPGRSPGEGNGNPLKYSCQENSMDREAWQGYSPWGHKKSDMTEDTCIFIYIKLQDSGRR